MVLLECPKCKAPLLNGVFNQPLPTPCSSCRTLLQVEVFPALFRPIGPGHAGEAIMVEGESSCFYHSQKKAVRACDMCGRFLCALCDCELKGRHLCPACLESGQKKQKIQGLEDLRVLYQRQALIVSFIPLIGPIAIFLALRYWKTPGSLVSPMRWAMPVALTFGILQALLIAFLLVLAFTK